MKNKKGFTLIELIVVIALLGILSAIAVPRFNGFRKQANKAIIISNIKNLEDACAMYNIVEGGWPTDGDYGGSKTLGFYSVNGEIESLGDGNHYQIDYDKIKSYIDKPEDPERYILRNPIGRVYYIKEEGSGNGNPANEEEGYIMTDGEGNQYVFKSELTSEELMTDINNSSSGGVEVDLGAIIKEGKDYYIAKNTWFGQNNKNVKISDYEDILIKINDKKVYTDADKVPFEYNNDNLVWPEEIVKGSIYYDGKDYYVAPSKVGIWDISSTGNWLKVKYNE